MDLYITGLQLQHHRPQFANPSRVCETTFRGRLALSVGTSTVYPRTKRCSFRDCYTVHTFENQSLWIRQAEPWHRPFRIQFVPRLSKWAERKMASGKTAGRGKLLLELAGQRNDMRMI